MLDTRICPQNQISGWDPAGAVAPHSEEQRRCQDFSKRSDSATPEVDVEVDGDVDELSKPLVSSSSWSNTREISGVAQSHLRARYATSS